MEHFKKMIFTRESGIRHLVMLGITFLVLVWTFIAMAWLQNDWNWLTDTYSEAEDSEGIMRFWGMLTTWIGIAACLGALVYLNAVKWMVPWLKNSFIAIFGWLPFVERLTPAFHNSLKGMKLELRKLKRRARRLPKGSEERQRIERMVAQQKTAVKNRKQREWEAEVAYGDAFQKAFDEYQREKAIHQMDDMSKGLYFDDKFYFDQYFPDVETHEYSYYDDVLEPTGDEETPVPRKVNINSSIGSNVWSSVPDMEDDSLIWRVVKGIGYLIGAIGIPVFSPLFMLLGMGVISAMIKESGAILLTIGIIFVVMVTLIYVVHPILSLKSDN